MPDDVTRLENTGLSEKASDPTGQADSDAIATLSRELEALKDARAEERFIWVVSAIVLFDAFVFDKMASWSGPIVIGVIQFLLLIVLARKLGIQEVSQVLAKLLDRAAEITQSNNRKQ